MAEAEEKQVPQSMQFADFLERIPPGVTTEIQDLFKGTTATSTHSLSDTDIQLYCESDTCKGIRFFSGYTWKRRARYYLNTRDFYYISMP